MKERQEVHSIAEVFSVGAGSQGCEIDRPSSILPATDLYPPQKQPRTKRGTQALDDTRARLAWLCFHTLLLLISCSSHLKVDITRRWRPKSSSLTALLVLLQLSIQRTGRCESSFKYTFSVLSSGSPAISQSAPGPVIQNGQREKLGRPYSLSAKTTPTQLQPQPRRPLSHLPTPHLYSPPRLSLCGRHSQHPPVTPLLPSIVTIAGVRLPTFIGPPLDRLRLTPYELSLCYPCRLDLSVLKLLIGYPRSPWTARCLDSRPRSLPTCN
ncbi:uncharacterized protein BDR25DRAFT_351024 [Lindgomyces ingoldianus]|uniref:Uncharacterized protein n=1 Tax=Lindgomyces ingoldianus TaxID=673940 RepID=A0ACB6R7K9_9PLEO|nr:uncharacterized protein BDR25DRAFT_351024 [Lindgomyces ingoldianus]KAF2474507.1 hypothetical protein BDR25DRAFT_351024 [Lindgomyces ingoldianus]